MRNKKQKYNEVIDKYKVLHEDNNQIVIRFGEREGKPFSNGLFSGVEIISCMEVFANHMKGNSDKYDGIQCQSETSNRNGQTVFFTVTFNKKRK